MKNLQSAVAAICAALLIAPSGQAEEPVSRPIPGVLKPSWHTRFTHRYTPRDIAPVNMVNSDRLDQLVRAGNLYLSLRDAIALALENNLDIELQRYGPQIAEADLLRAQAGGVVRGVPLNISTASSSAGLNLQTGGGAGISVGSGASGGTGATGGASVIFSGTQLPNLDESITVGYNWDHRTAPLANSFTTGIPALVFDSGALQMGVQRGFITGTNVSLSYSQTGQLSNNRVAEINPVTNSNLSFTIQQRLLQGFGLAVNNRFIRIAKNDLRVSDLVFKQQVITTVSAVVNLYSDLVAINEDVKVKKQALTLATKLYEDNKKQVEIGTLAPIEIIRAEAEVARRQQELTTSETNLLQQETLIKNALSRHGIATPVIAEVRIIPLDTLEMPATESIRPVQDLVQLAVENRPELQQTAINIENSRISLQGSRSQMLPALDVFASMQNNGLAGEPNTFIGPDGRPIVRPANPAFIGGANTALAQIFRRNYPNYGVGFQLTIPVRNRSAQADMIRDSLTLRQSELRQRQQLNQVRVDVQNALIGLQQSRARLQSAQKERQLQEQTLDAEQKKYALGASTIFFVIQAQRDLAQAQASEVQAMASYNRSRVQLNVATGQLLDVFGVTLDEAMKGKVSRAPSKLPAVDRP